MALEATQRLVTQADYAGAEIVLRGLQDRDAERAELLGVRRLFTRLRQVLLETADVRSAP